MERCSRCSGLVEWPAGVRLVDDAGAPLCLTHALSAEGAGAVRASQLGARIAADGRFLCEQTERSKDEAFRRWVDANPGQVAKLERVAAKNRVTIAGWQAKSAADAKIDAPQLSRRLEALEATIGSRLEAIEAKTAG